MERVKKTVLIFDICSSSTIIENLHKSKNEGKWRQVIMNLSRFLQNYDMNLFEVYKFQGDGWILVFDDELNLDLTFSFIGKLCEFYEENFNNHIKNLLNETIHPNGIAFGMDRGFLYYLQLNNKEEYWGRCLNIATRLQTSIKDNDKNPQYKILMTNQLYHSMSNFLKNKGYRVERARRKLRNIDNKRMEYKKIILR